MKIASVQALAFDRGFQKQALQTTRVASPMSRFERFSEKRAKWMWPTKKAFVRVEFSDGTVGWGCTNGGEVVTLIINEHLAPLLIGQPADDLAELWDQMFLSLLPCDRSGFAMMAVAAVDIALWDARAKSAGMSLTQLLGGASGAALPVYVTTPRPAVHANDGWAGIKAAAPFGPEAGKDGLHANVAHLRRFRDAVGPDVPIMLDAFMAWDAEYALTFLDAAQHLSLHWIEDPLPPYDMEGMRRLKAEMNPSTALALGNFAFNRHDCADLLREGLVDVLQPDVAWAGGISETLRILDMATEAKVPVILHNSCEQPWALSLAATRQDGAMVEFVDRGDHSQLYDLIGPRAQIAGGHVRVPDDPQGNRPPADVLEQFVPGQAHAQIQAR